MLLNRVGIEIVAYLKHRVIRSQIYKYLDLFPALRDFDEETSCWRDEGHGSLCVSDRVLHHTLTGRKCLHLKRKERRKTQTSLETCDSNEIVKSLKRVSLLFKEMALVVLQGLLIRSIFCIYYIFCSIRRNKFTYRWRATRRSRRSRRSGGAGNGQSYRNKSTF